MGNVSSLAVDVCIRMNITNYTDKNLIVKSPGCPKLILYPNESADVSSDSVVSIDSYSVVLWNVNTEQLLGESYNEYYERLKNIFTLGDYYIHYNKVHSTLYEYKVIRMSTSVEDDKDYGEVAQFGIDNRYGSRIPVVLYNYSPKNLLTIASRRTGFLLRPGCRTCYPVYYSTDDMDPNQIIYTNNNRRECHKNSYYIVRISNKTTDVITVETKSNSNVMILPRSYQEVRDVQRIFTMNGTVIPYQIEREVKDVILDIDGRRGDTGSDDIDGRRGDTGSDNIDGCYLFRIDNTGDDITTISVEYGA